MKFKPIPHDPTLEAARVQCAIFRRMHPEERVRIAMELSEAVRANLEAGIRHRHPEYTTEAVKLATTRVIIGEELFRKAYPDVEVTLMSQSELLARIKAILSKLEWAKAGGLERQYRDALGIASVQWSDLDWEYMKKWAPILGVENLLLQLWEDAETLQS